MNAPLNPQAVTKPSIFSRLRAKLRQYWRGGAVLSLFGLFILHADQKIDTLEQRVIVLEHKDLEQEKLFALKLESHKNIFDFQSQELEGQVDTLKKWVACQEQQERMGRKHMFNWPTLECIELSAPPGSGGG